MFSEYVLLVMDTQLQSAKDRSLNATMNKYLRNPSASFTTEARVRQTKPTRKKEREEEEDEEEESAGDFLKK